MIVLPTIRSSYKKKQRNVLDLFSVEGEGGYNPYDYTFMFKGSAFFNTDIYSSVANICADDTKFKSLTIGSNNYKFLENILRISLGNNNACIMYRDGSVDIRGRRTQFTYLADVMYDIVDTFTPSTYAGGNTQYKQLLLLKNGDLVEIDCYNKTNTTILTDVNSFVTKNQAHRCDAMVSTKDDSLYHVWVGPSPLGAPGYDGNGTATGVHKIIGLKYSEIIFATIGDPPAAATFCYKKDPKNIYRFNKGYGTNFKITGIQSTPIPSMRLDDENEYYLDGMSQEFNSLFLTNKRALHRSSSNGTSDYSEAYKVSEWRYSKNWNFTIGKKICTPTAYTMIVEDIYGKFWLAGFSGSGSYVLTEPSSYIFFDTLKNYLLPIKNAS